MEINLNEYIKRTHNSIIAIKNMRGNIINQSVSIENELTNVITRCFFPSKYSRNTIISKLLNEEGTIFKSLILNKIDFRDKIVTLKDLIKVKKPQVLGKNKALITSIIKELDEIREFRNIMAHAEFDISIEFLDSAYNLSNKKLEKYQFIEYKKGKITRKLFDHPRYISEMNKMSRVRIRLAQLFALLNDDQQGAENYEDLFDILKVR